MDDSTRWLFYTGLLLAVVFIAFGVLLIKFGNKEKENGKKNIAQLIAGWFFLVFAIVGFSFGFIVFINATGGIGGIYIYIFVSPFFIFAGFIACFSIAISSLVEGYHKNKEGKVDSGSIVRGWALLILSIAVIVVIIVTLAVLLNNYSSARGDKPIRMM